MPDSESREARLARIYGVPESEFSGAGEEGQLSQKVLRDGNRSAKPQLTQKELVTEQIKDVKSLMFKLDSQTSRLGGIEDKIELQIKQTQRLRRGIIALWVIALSQALMIFVLADQINSFIRAIRGF
jgi:hypothetical protein